MDEEAAMPSLLQILEEARTLEDIAQIGTLLDQGEERMRQETAAGANEDARDGSRESRADDAIAEGSPSEEAAAAVAGSAARGGEAAEGGGVPAAVEDDETEEEDVPSELDAAPKMTDDEETREMASLSERDKLEARAGIYGTPLEKTATERLMESMEAELNLIPTEKKRAYRKAQLSDPLLFGSSAHAKLFLRGSNFDPKVAADRLVQYWEKRYELLGDAAFSSTGGGATNLRTNRMTSDEIAECFRVYEKAVAAVTDPHTEHETLQVALSFVRRLEASVIADLDDELRKIPLHEKGALVEAQKSIPHVASSDEDKLMFLRSEDFDAKGAARRMVNYWDFKLDLFGREVAFGGGRVSSAPSDFRRELSLGVFSVVPGYDSSGRTVICFRPARLVPGSYDHDGILKSAWYVLNAALEQYHAHPKGIVFTVVQRGMQPRLYDVRLNSQIARLLLRTLPIKIRAVHQCGVPSSFLFTKFVHPFVRYLLGKYRVRAWLHAGTDEEIVSELRECGMSLDQIPAELGGNFGLDSYERWLEQRMSDGV